MRTCVLLLVCGTALLGDGVAGLKWTAPPGWKSQGTTEMRAATYPVAPAPGDKEGSECVVYFFGQGSGGTVQANMDRWKGQLTGPGGKPAAAKIATENIHGLRVTTIDVSGAYSGMGGPLAQEEKVVPGYRLLGAIIEGPGGNVFIKFVGPAKTITANQAKFKQLLDSFEKTGK
jgi:hypothetical protein